MRRLAWTLFIGVLSQVLLAPPGGAQDLPMPDLGISPDAFPVVKSAGQGTGVIDMENRTVRVVTWGTCVPDEAATDAGCIVTAYTVARASGMQSLSEIVGKLEVGMGYSSNGINEASGETIIRSSAFLKGVREVPGTAPNGLLYKGNKYMPDNSILAWVTLEMPLQGAVLGAGLDHPTLRGLLEQRIKERSLEVSTHPLPTPPTPAPE